MNDILVLFFFSINIFFLGARSPTLSNFVNRPDPNKKRISKKMSASLFNTVMNDDYVQEVKKAKTTASKRKRGAKQEDELRLETLVEFCTRGVFGIDVVAYFTNPNLFQVWSEIVLERIGGAVIKPVYEVTEGFQLNGDAITEAMKYFPHIVHKRLGKQHVYSCLDKLGLPISKCPSHFAIHSCYETKTVLVDRDLMRAIWARYPLTRRQIDAPTATFMIKGYGRDSFANIGYSYDRTRAMPMHKMISRAHDVKREFELRTHANTGWPLLVVPNDFSLYGILKEERAIIQTFSNKKLEYMKAGLGILKESPRIPVEESKLAVCIIFNEEGQLLSYPFLRSNFYMRFPDNRKK